MRLISKSASWITLLTAILLGATIARAQRKPEPMRAIRFLQNVPYNTGPNADRKFQIADLYLPEGKKNFPTLLFIHGGGYKAGDKNYAGIDKIVDICVDMGIGVMSIDYRLFPAVTFGQEMQDVALAFAWLYKNGSQYGADPNTIFVAGGSAGGHMAALFATDPRYLQEQGLSLKQIKGVILSSGVYDAENFYTLGEASGEVASQTATEHNSSVGMLQGLIKTTFGTDPATLREFSADTYVGKIPNLPPFLIAYTDDDYYGMAAQANGFYSLLVSHNLPAELIEQPGRIHATKTSGIGEKQKGANDVFGPAIKYFLQSVLDGTFAPTTLAGYQHDPAPSMKVVKDLRYDDSSGSDAKLNTLDLYLPEGKSNVPVAFFVHGGGWRGGDKANPDTIGKLCARMGVALASVDYRLAPQSKYPAQIDDVADAFAWIYDHAGEYQIDRNRIIVMGGSAGGHLVSLLALNTEYLAKVGVPADAIKGVISISGLYDLPAWPEPGLIPTRKEQAFGDDPAVLRQASPTTYIRADAPPFLLTFTDWDLYMIRENTIEMYNLMLNKGAAVELVMVPGRNHQGIAEIGKNVNQIDDLLGPAIMRFFVQHLQIAPSASVMAASR